MSVPEPVSAKSIRRWLTGYEKYGIAALYDNVAQRGNYNRVLLEDERRLMYAHVAGFLSDLKKTPAKIVADVQAAFTAENERRVAEGLPELSCPSRITIRAAIYSLDPFRVKMSREGKDAARRAYSPVGLGIDVERPMQRVELDEQMIDLISLMEDSGLLNYLTKEEKEALGLDGDKGRWWITVALCVRTRCIIGMSLTRTPNTRSALQTVEMAMRDKGVWADAVGALDPWDQFGMIGTLVTDCGKPFVSHEFRARMHDLGVNVLHTPAAAPWLKPYIERVFRTFSTRLMPRLSGCTFGDIVRRGSSNPQANAALTVDQLCAVLVRWIVDIYHNTPHEGLDGETPRNCWLRLTEKFGVTPPPSLPRRRLIFGREDTRTLEKDGITIMGVRYHSRQLAEHFMHSHDTKMELRWYPEDIGAIWVKIGSQWSPVSAVHDCFHGVSAQHWLVARRELRVRYAAEAQVKASVVAKALDFIGQLNAQAMNTAGLMKMDWSKERVEREERQCFVGFRVGDDDDDDDAVASSAREDRWGEALPTADATVVEAVEEKFENLEEISSAPAESTESPAHHQGVADNDDDEDDGETLVLWDK
jgi:putative transposase